MMEIKTLDKVGFEKLYDAFNQAFADYSAFETTEHALELMLERRGYSPEHSFGAFDQDKLVSFTFYGIGKHVGKTTAYDTGTGTLNEYRGQKLAGQLFEESIPHLKKKGVEQYLLEVLQDNTSALKVYKSNGFQVSREFNYYVIETDKLKSISYTLPKEYKMKEIVLIELDVISSFWNFEPAWQNSIDSINRSSDDFTALGIYKGRKLVAYIIFEPKSGDITQLAVDKKHRRKGLATALICEAVQLSQHHLLQILNTEAGCISMEKFIESLNIPLTGKQYEMIREI